MMFLSVFRDITKTCACNLPIFLKLLKIENFQWKMFDIFLDLLKLMIVCIRQNRLGEAVLITIYVLEQK